MKRLFVFCIILVFKISAGAASSLILPTDKLSHLETQLDILCHYLKIPGCSAGIVKVAELVWCMEYR